MDNQVIRVVNCLAEDIGTPRALAVKLMVNAGEWTQLQQLKCRPLNYFDSESFWKDSMITDLLRKCDLDTDVDKEAAAVATFIQCEKDNAATNARLSRYLPSKLFVEPEDVPVLDFISLWRKEVCSVMGNLPDHLTPKFSPGATYADTGKLITTPDKMSSTPTIYAEARSILPLWQRTSWFRALCEERPWQSDPNTVRGNIFFTVPKDGLKFRGCGKEASIPVTYQLAVGQVLKKRLLRIGLDLLGGQDVHRQLAREGSVNDDLATIDMSNASDTVCRVLVQLLVRGDWHELLSSLRAPMTRVDGKWYRLEKFSSMGNGFTFELETIIFATLARVLIRQEGGDPDLVKCYGDDLIVPAKHYKSIVSALKLFGFQPNMNKTFSEGPFRESCGGDFWSGVPVRAHFIEELPDEPQHWISLANGLRRVAFAYTGNLHRWRYVRRAWFCALDPIPSDIRRCRGPEHLGDVVIHDAKERWSIARAKRSHHREVVYDARVFGPCQPNKTQVKRKVVDGNPSQGDVYIHAYLPVPKVLPWNHWLPSVQLACCTLGLPSDGLTPRGAVEGWKIGVVGALLTSPWTPKPMRYRREATIHH